MGVLIKPAQRIAVVLQGAGCHGLASLMGEPEPHPVKLLF